MFDPTCVKVKLSVERYTLKAVSLVELSTQLMVIPLEVTAEVVNVIGAFGVIGAAEVNEISSMAAEP